MSRTHSPHLMQAGPIERSFVFLYETVTACPACGSADVVPIYSGVPDRLFGAPGTTDIARCRACGSLHCNPRITAGTIARAYETYYTHAARSEKPQRTDPLMQVEDAFWRRLLGKPLSPGQRALALLQHLRPWRVARMRHSLRLGRAPHPGALLADIGCGNGDYLHAAQEAGWDCVGVDFDSGAVQACARQGIAARHGGVDALSDMRGRLHAVTLSHVIEHVHDAKSLLSNCHDLLAPGGVLWIETPNAQSAGHTRFNKNWRGLEPPRHLTIFSREALIHLLLQVGFRDIRDNPWTPLRFTMYAESSALALGLEPGHFQAGLPQKLRWMAGDFRERADCTTREFVSLTARR